MACSRPLERTCGRYLEACSSLITTPYPAPASASTTGLTQSSCVKKFSTHSNTMKSGRMTVQSSTRWKTTVPRLSVNPARFPVRLKG